MVNFKLYLILPQLFFVGEQLPLDQFNTRVKNENSLKQTQQYKTIADSEITWQSHIRTKTYQTVSRN
jgi:hypothetical protein